MTDTLRNEPMTLPLVYTVCVTPPGCVSPMRDYQVVAASEDQAVFVAREHIWRTTGVAHFDARVTGNRPCLLRMDK